MRILLLSYAFAPSVGGIETVSRLLAEEFLRAGHELKLITDTPDTEPNQFPYPVFRRPRARQLFALHSWAEIVFHNNISLNYAWPLLLFRRPWFVAHHIWIGDSPRPHWRERLKLRLLRFATNISISRAVARSLPVPAEIVGDPYDDSIFFSAGAVSPQTATDLIYTGRLVSDKGVDLLLQAVARLRGRGLRPGLTIAGDGSDKTALQNLAAELGLESQVTFVGQKAPAELAALLRAHRVHIVPSRWEEPFGIVALEGLACGCELVIAESGGLVEAAGGCATVFKRGDAAALEAALAEVLSPNRVRSDPVRRRAHLQQHTKAAVARRYLDLFQASR